MPPNFVSRLRPTLDRIRARIPSDLGLRSVHLTVRRLTLTGPLIEGGEPVVEDKEIVGPGGSRYKARVVSTTDVIASGGKYQHGAIKVGPLTPPYPGGTYTAEDLVPPSLPNQEVYYGLTDATGQTQWCTMASSDTIHDLHWYLVLNPTGTVPEGDEP